MIFVRNSLDILPYRAFIGGHGLNFTLHEISDVFADGVGIVFHRVVEALGGDGAEVGPPGDGVLDPGRPRVEPRLHVNVQLGNHCVVLQPLVVVRHHLIHILQSTMKLFEGNHNSYVSKVSL